MPLLGSFNGLGPGGPEAMIRKWKRERGWYSLVYAENQWSPWHRTCVSHEGTGRPLEGGWRHRVLSRESLRSLGRRVSKSGLCAPRNQPRRDTERERERERKCHSVLSNSMIPWTAAHQASLHFTISCSLLKFMFIESVMSSNHLILCCPLSSSPQSLAASVSFPMSWHQVGKVLELQL